MSSTSPPEEHAAEYRFFRDDPECGPEYSIVPEGKANLKIGSGTHERVCRVLTHEDDEDMVLVKRKDPNDGSC